MESIISIRREHPLNGCVQKPTIPLTGNDGIPIHDEPELEKWI